MDPTTLDWSGRIIKLGVGVCSGYLLYAWSIKFVSRLPGLLIKFALSRCGGAGAAAASETFEFGGAEGDQALPVSVYPDAWSWGESGLAV